MQKERVASFSDKVQSSNNRSVYNESFVKGQYDDIILLYKNEKGHLLLSSINNAKARNVEQDRNCSITFAKYVLQVQRITLNKDITAVEKLQSTKDIIEIKKETEVFTKIQQSILRQVPTRLGGALCVKM